MLETGQGIAPDDVQAEEWYRKAAKQGQVKAQSSLGCLLGPESADPARRVEALTWLLVASNKGEITAQKLLDSIRSGINKNDLVQARKLAGEVEKSLRGLPSK